MSRRVCKSCRRRVGLCFLCHEPVKGVYVWCPGCGMLRGVTTFNFCTSSLCRGFVTHYFFTFLPYCNVQLAAWRLVSANIHIQKIGHGGHLEHALEWFGGSSGTNTLRTMCPTGCGHQCNLMKDVSAFPRTESFS
jgi:hypothetical protein